jgi:hypothetical protein
MAGTFLYRRPQSTSDAFRKNFAAERAACLLSTFSFCSAERKPSRVAVAQMRSTGDIEANFQSVAKLVKVSLWGDA